MITKTDSYSKQIDIDKSEYYKIRNILHAKPINSI